MPKPTPSSPTAIKLVDSLQQGLRLHQEGKHAEAQACFARILERDPRNAKALWFSGRALLELKQIDQAIPNLEQAIAILPNFAGLRFDLGQAYFKANRTPEAIECYRAATKLKPEWGMAWCHVGNAQRQAKQYAEAERTLRHALTLSDYHAETLNYLGLVVMALGRHDEANEYFLAAIRDRPKYCQPWTNLGSSLLAHNKTDEALFAYQQALAIEPKSAVTKFNLSLLLLSQGNYSRSVWLKYEYRWVNLKQNPHRGFEQPLWRGEESLASKSILLYAEQGLGDTLQFVRYASVLAARGATVHVEVQPALKLLLQDLPGAASVIGRGDPLPQFDFHCPLLSMPFAVDTRLETIPAEPSYLRAPPDRVARWQARLALSQRLRVGVVWRGNPLHANDANRSIPFEQFRRVFDAEGCDFVGLQLDLNETESSTLARHDCCMNSSKQIADFADTAAIISHLDLVLTVDTSVAHLAGALGKPVWLLLPLRPDWRWLLDRKDSPWYPTMRLFRQPAFGDWASVIARVGAELQQTASRLPVADPLQLKSA